MRIFLCLCCVLFLAAAAAADTTTTTTTTAMTVADDASGEAFVLRPDEGRNVQLPRELAAALRAAKAAVLDN